MPIIISAQKRIIKNGPKNGTPHPPNPLPQFIIVYSFGYRLMIEQLFIYYNKLM
jgi:hypothetical protein